MRTRHRIGTTIQCGALVWLVVLSAWGTSLSIRAQVPDDHAAFLDNYVGRYQLTATFGLTVTREGDALYIQATGQPRTQLRPRSRTEFVVVGSSLRLIFVMREDTGEVDHLIFEQGGLGRRVEKTSDAVGNVDARETVELSAEILQRYVGTYEEQPGFAITITRDGSQLIAQLTGQPQTVVFPESETEFFYPNTTARLSFRLGLRGEVEALILHQGGSDLRLIRVAD